MVVGGSRSENMKAIYSGSRLKSVKVSGSL